MKYDHLKLCIAGKGGLARETALIAKAHFDINDAEYFQHMAFLVKDEDWTTEQIMKIPQLKEKDFDQAKHKVVVAVGNSELKKTIVNKLPQSTAYPVLSHPRSDISEFVSFGRGSIIASGVIITCDVKIGNHTTLDRLVTVGHDTQIGNFVHISPGAVVSGNCKIGDECFLGAGCLIKEGINIANNVIIGMGAVVVNSIEEAGVYVGNPAKLLKS